MDTVPTTIEEWYNKAIHFKTQWERADILNNRKKTFSSPNQKTYTPHRQTQPLRDPNTMDVDAIRLENSPTMNNSAACTKAYASDVVNQDILQTDAKLMSAQTITHKLLELKNSLKKLPLQLWIQIFKKQYLTGARSSYLY